jgi:ATP synthase protein I
MLRALAKGLFNLTSAPEGSGDRHRDGCRTCGSVIGVHGAGARRESAMKEVDNGQSDDRAMRERLEKLSSSLDRKRTEQENGKRAGDDQAAAGQQTGRAIATGFRIVTELAAGVIVGCVMGWYLDAWLGTTPLFLIVFIALGTAAGFWNMMRIGTGLTGRKPRGP